MVGRCSVYMNRPQRCREYPVAGDFLPPDCTFFFVGNERQGECRPDVCLEGNCCAYPREGGEPVAKSLDTLAGGLPCKHLVWAQDTSEPAKTASGEGCPTRSFLNQLIDLSVPHAR